MALHQHRALYQPVALHQPPALHQHLALNQHRQLLVWTKHHAMEASNAMEVSTPLAACGNVAGTDSQLRQTCNQVLSSAEPEGSRPTWLAGLGCQHQLSAGGGSGCGKWLAALRIAWGGSWGLHPVPACTASRHTSPGSLDSGGQGSALQS